MKVYDNLVVILLIFSGCLVYKIHRLIDNMARLKAFANFVKNDAYRHEKMMTIEEYIHIYQSATGENLRPFDDSKVL